MQDGEKLRAFTAELRIEQLLQLLHTLHVTAPLLRFLRMLYQKKVLNSNRYEKGMVWKCSVPLLPATQTTCLFSDTRLSRYLAAPDSAHASHTVSHSSH